MVLVRQLYGRIGEVAAPVLAAGEPGRDPHPAMKTRSRIGKGCLELRPPSLRLLRLFAQAGGDQLVLRAEMPVERHFVGASGLGDRVNPDALDAVLAKQIARRVDDPLPRPRLRAQILHRRLRSESCRGALTGV
jgi:hypothetical protein